VPPPLSEAHGGFTEAKKNCRAGTTIKKILTITITAITTATTTTGTSSTSSTRIPQHAQRAQTTKIKTNKGNKKQKTANTATATATAQSRNFILNRTTLLLLQVRQTANNQTDADKYDA